MQIAYVLDEIIQCLTLLRVPSPVPQERLVELLQALKVDGVAAARKLDELLRRQHTREVVGA